MSNFFSPSHKKTIFFDMNNTLVDRRHCFDSAFMEAVSEYTARWDPDDITWSVQDSLQSYKQEWSKHRNTASRASLLPQELRQLCLTKALQPYPIAVNLAFARSFFDRVEQQEDRYVSLFPGVEDTLRSLTERFKLAIISNGNRDRLKANLTRLKLDEWFTEDRLFSSRGSGQRKPHPELFESAISAMNTAPSHSVMVGNSWKNDIVGSTNCGLDAIWIHPAHIKKVSHRKLGKQKVVIIRSFKQLLHIL